MKQAAADVGRDPDGLKICSLFYPVVAATRAEAEDKKAAYDKLPNEMDQLSLLSEALNFDFASKGMDETFSDDELEGIAGMQSMRDRVRDALDRSPTVRDFMEITGRGLLREAWVEAPPISQTVSKSGLAHPPVTDSSWLQPISQVALKIS